MPEIRGPKTCDVWLPNQCMLRCKMCYLWKGDAVPYKEAVTLKIEDYKKIFCDLKDLVDDSFSVSFGGGEPLLEFDLLRSIAEICSEMDFKTYFPTNAYLIDDAMAEKIKEAKISSIGISLESMDKSVHDNIRGKRGSWDRIMKAIECLSNNCHGIFTNILTVIMAENLEGIIELTKWVYNHPKLFGINFQAVQTPFNSVCPENWRELDEYADIWPRDIRKVRSVIDELIRLKQTHGKDNFKIGNSITQLELFKLYFDDPRSFVKPDRCHLGDVISIDSLGNIRTCYEMGPIGNIREQNIRDIWYSKKAEGIRSRIYNCDKNCYHLINCYYG